MHCMHVDVMVMQALVPPLPSPLLYKNQTRSETNVRRRRRLSILVCANITALACIVLVFFFLHLFSFSLSWISTIFFFIIIWCWCLLCCPSTTRTHVDVSFNSTKKSPSSVGNKYTIHHLLCLSASYVSNPLLFFSFPFLYPAAAAGFSFFIFHFYFLFLWLCPTKICSCGEICIGQCVVYGRKRISSTLCNMNNMHEHGRQKTDKQ
ncbi:hypothetical protein BCR41DRAFT_22902 [Lobosporangium transversale]|uniref:Uncharacterized protein n=1 Tax=Lobosporangium transversale TaxID=64571 RepID=A0A1Y2GST2_9FUNG|nr:hypothetical protein BCR41DRAFT_22902 [Lobosporangium transversale]ORZ21881.1 hypothetical protein BCR41DRAFT_22902 [Lobosporangium transversale]|eukprot:XP_021883132.1 hypothetical protein BCR41DRAFT_22902 [Lobosporangium transversale]